MKSFLIDDKVFGKNVSQEVSKLGTTLIFIVRVPLVNFFQCASEGPALPTVFGIFLFVESSSSFGL